LSSFLASALGVDEEPDGAALDEDDDEDEGGVLEAPLLEGEELLDGEELELLDGGVLVLEDDDGEEEDGALDDGPFLASSRPQAVRANAAATAIRRALFIKILWLSGVGGFKAARNSRNSQMKLQSRGRQFRTVHSPTVVPDTAG
jgi:hypothetical protein